jgi:hypothetical protein
MSNEEDEYSIKHPIVSYAFAIMEYVQSTDPELFKRAVEYAEDLTGVNISDFKLEEIEEDEEERENDITEEIEEDIDIIDEYEDDE